MVKLEILEHSKAFRARVMRRLQMDLLVFHHVDFLSELPATAFKRAFERFLCQVNIKVVVEVVPFSKEFLTIYVSTLEDMKES